MVVVGLHESSLILSMQGIALDIELLTIDEVLKWVWTLRFLSGKSFVNAFAKSTIEIAASGLPIL